MKENQMQTAMSNQQQRQMIWSRRMAQMDHDSQIASAKSEAADQKNRDNAKGFKHAGVDPQFIAGVTGLSLKEIAAL